MSPIDKLKLKAKILVKAKKRSGISVRLKDALNIVARYLGFRSWRELRRNGMETELYIKATGITSNLWCKTYSEAQVVQKQYGGFLLPYRKQYFVCSIEYIKELGISPDDLDLVLAGNDWANPKDSDALRRLNKKIKSHI